MAEPQTYTELQASLLAWLDDSSTNVNPTECIGLAERRLSRLLNVPEMEASTTLDASLTVIDLPADFREVRSLSVVGTSTAILEPVSIQTLRALYPSTLNGIPRAYAIQGLNIVLGPQPSATCSLSLFYKQSIPSLSDANPTNWLLTKHPDLYLAASLAMAEFRGWNDARLPMLKGWYDELLMEVNEAGKRARFAGGPLRMRTSISEGAGRPGPSADILSDGSDLLVDG